MSRGLLWSRGWKSRHAINGRNWVFFLPQAFQQSAIVTTCWWSGTDNQRTVPRIAYSKKSTRIFWGLQPHSNITIITRNDISLGLKFSQRVWGLIICCDMSVWPTWRAPDFGSGLCRFKSCHGKNVSFWKWSFSPVSACKPSIWVAYKQKALPIKIVELWCHNCNLFLFFYSMIGIHPEFEIYL